MSEKLSIKDFEEKNEKRTKEILANYTPMLDVVSVFIEEKNMKFIELLICYAHVSGASEESKKFWEGFENEKK